MSKTISITNDELKEMIKEGYFFNFCCGVAINKGFANVIRDKKECVFSVGEYDVKFVPETIHFELNHKVYFARIIHAHYHGVEFIGNDEQEVIQELMTEFERECALAGN